MEKSELFGGSLLGYGGFGCVFYPKYNCKTKKFNKKGLTVSKIQKKRWKSKHEIYISSLVKKIKNYEFFFVPVLSWCDVKINQIKDDEIHDCPIIKKHQEFYSMELKRINGLDYIDLLKGEKKVKSVDDLMEDYLWLYHSIKILMEKKLVHFDIKGENVMFNIETSKPLIIDFGLSLSQVEIEKNLSNYFYVYDPSYYLWSPEIHLINLILNIGKPNNGEIKEMLNKYFNNRIFLDGFSSSFLKEMKGDYERYFQKMCESKDEKDIINELLKFWSHSQ